MFHLVWVSHSGFVSLGGSVPNIHVCGECPHGGQPADPGGAAIYAGQSSTNSIAVNGDPNASPVAKDTAVYWLEVSKPGAYHLRAHFAGGGAKRFLGDDCWPERVRDEQNWLHTDLKDLSYFGVHLLFDEITPQGGMR